MLSSHKLNSQKKKQGHICCPPENDSPRNLHNGKALDLPIFCENVLFSLHFRQTSRARFIALKVALLRYPKIIVPNSTTVTSFHTYKPSCSSSAALHGVHLHVQSNKDHNTKRNPTTLWSWPLNSLGAPARTGQPATCK